MAARKSEFDSLFAGLEKLNPYGSTLDKYSLSITDEDWLDSGSYALNLICSGSLLKGAFPRGRITGLTGPSSTGKSLIIGKAIAKAQEQGYYAVIWDSEGAWDVNFAKNLGIDPTRCKVYPIDTVENLRNQISKLLDNILEKKKEDDKEVKIIIAIDSTGNLSSIKEVEDAGKDKSASDMGLRAKALKSLFRVLTYKASITRIPILFSNHIYDDPSAMFPSMVKNQSGGRGAVYLSSILVQLSQSLEKEDKNEGKETIEIANNVTGVSLNALTVKNRFIPPFLKSSFFVHFKSGVEPYSGLFDIALQMGYIVNTGKTYELHSGEKIGYRKNIESNATFWETHIKHLDEFIHEKMKYGATILQDLDAKKQFEELEKEVLIEEGDAEEDETD